MKFVFVIHCHQPAGNFDHVVDDHVDRAYLPFLDALEAAPDMQVGVHYSGTLLRWAVEHRPDLIERLAASRDQAEFLGGGLTEPILATLPDQWRRRQIAAHTSLVRELFEEDPAGIWLGERVWEPTLAWILHDLDIAFTLLDQSLFEASGLSPWHPAVVDHLGRTVRVLPISRALRHGLPGLDPPQIIAYLRDIHEQDPDAVVVAADDGEKYGAWEGTSARVYDEGWLGDLFDAVTESAWIDIVRPSAAAAGAATRGSLTAGSYSEMSDWLTDPGAPWPGPWKRFLTRYPEANVIYRKMLAVATNPKLPTDAVDPVLAAQASDPLWHGTFGGVYLPHLRAAAHTALIEARVAVDSGRRGRSWSDLTVRDWDADGEEELHVELPDQSWVLERNGAMSYYDDKPSRWCLSDVMARHGERYHNDTQQFDGVPRRWMQVRHAAPDAGPPTLFDPHDFEAAFDLETAEASRGSVTIRMAATAGDASLVKTLVARDRTVEIAYELDGIRPGRFGPELPLAIWPGSGRIRVDGGDWHSLDADGAFNGHRFRVQHLGRATQVLIDLRMPGSIFVAPLVTAVRTQNGLEEVAQGVVLWPHFLTDGTGHYTMSVSVDDVEEPD